MYQQRLIKKKSQDKNKDCYHGDTQQTVQIVLPV